jgi:hypothetical protein
MSPELIDVLINWFPMLLIAGIWIFFVRKMSSAKAGGTYGEQVELTRRQTELLERIAVALEKRNRLDR